MADLSPDINQQISPPSDSAPDLEGLPFGIIILAIFSILFGGLGVFFSFPSQIFHDEKETTPAEELDSMVEELPMEYRSEARRLFKSPEVGKLIDELTVFDDSGGISELIDQISAVLLSIIGLLAGIGLFARKKWGLILEILFIIIATVSTIIFGYFMIPELMGIIEIVDRNLPQGLDMEMLENFLFNSWLVLSAVLAVLHGGIIYYLTRPKIKELYGLIRMSEMAGSREESL